MTAQMKPVVRTAFAEPEPAPNPTPRWLHTLQLASKTLGHVLRNAGFSILVGWLTGYCYTLGNVASGETPAEQSYASYVTANGAWFHCGFSTFMIIIYAVRLLPEKFVTRSALNAISPSDGQEPPSRTLTLARCISKVLWHTAPYLVVFTAGEVVTTYVIMAYLPPSGRKYKPGMYVCAFWSNFIVAAVDSCSRHIFAKQTVRGLSREHLKESSQQGKQRDNFKQHRFSRRSCFSSARRFLGIYVRTLPLTVSSLIAIVYVHSISLFASIKRKSQLVAFAIGSIALKLVLQEVAKRYLLSTKKTLPHRTMIALVATPTILVDTQVRMLLMRLQDLSISVLGSAMLALMKIIVRVAKSRLVHQQHTVPAMACVKCRFTVSHDPAPNNTEHTQGTSVEIEASQQRHFIVHAAEIFADMYAEYMAMGCSYAIMFFFSNHPQYQFVLEKSHRTHQFFIFAFQVSVEVVVDFLACNLEALQGVDFGSFDQNDLYLKFFMSMLAFANVAISSGLYIHA